MKKYDKNGRKWNRERLDLIPLILACISWVDYISYYRSAIALPRVDWIT